MTQHPHDVAAWTNDSVRLLAEDGDATAVMSDLVADLLLAAADAGATSSPANPFEIAELMGIGLRPRFDVTDARLVTPVRRDFLKNCPHRTPTPRRRMDRETGRRGSGAAEGASVAGRTSAAPLRRFVASGADLVIEYNPTRPRGRLRYSVAHELAHALFPDANQDVRNRTHTGAVEQASSDDSWQLELLCNVAAAELLMPTHAIEGLVNVETDIDFLMAQRARFNVSTEALLRRLVHATDRPMALAAFNRISDLAASPLRCEYVLGSRAWAGTLGRGDIVELAATFSVPTAVGQTARGTGTVPTTGADDELSIQMVGIPPYPGRTLPRVLALLEPQHDHGTTRDGLTYATADIVDAIDDVTQDGPRVVVAHVVNDTARAWGGRGVAAALSRRVPDAARAYRSWTIADPENLTLGNVHQVQVTAGPVDQAGAPTATDAGAGGTADVGAGMATVASLVAQRGYGPSSAPRLNYTALAEALGRLAESAACAGAVVHMPRIGAGQAGGRWDLVETIIERTLLQRRVPVTVHTPPPSPGTRTTLPSNRGGR